MRLFIFLISFFSFLFSFLPFMLTAQGEAVSYDYDIDSLPVLGSEDYWVEYDKLIPLLVRGGANLIMGDPSLEDLIGLENVKPVCFQTDNERSIGLIAEDVKNFYPWLVYSFEDGTEWVDYEQIVPLLVLGYQKQGEIINQMTMLIEWMSESMIKTQNQINSLRILTKNLKD